MRPTQTNKSDEVLDYPKLVIKQMDRCNLALSQGAIQFSTAVLAFSCMLAHMKQRDEKWKADKKAIDIILEKQNASVKTHMKNANSQFGTFQMKSSILEYEALVRLCSRNGMFPARVGELDTDEG